MTAENLDPRKLAHDLLHQFNQEFIKTKGGLSLPMTGRTEPYVGVEVGRPVELAPVSKFATAMTPGEAIAHNKELKDAEQFMVALFNEAMKQSGFQQLIHFAGIKPSSTKFDVQAEDRWFYPSKDNPDDQHPNSPLGTRLFEGDKTNCYSLKYDVMANQFTLRFLKPEGAKRFQTEFDQVEKNLSEIKEIPKPTIADQTQDSLGGSNRKV